MDVQLKKGIIEACVLASLKRSDTYGYELLKRVTPILEVSESTLYPILRRLEKSGSLTTYSIEYEGRLRKYYKITKEGVNKLEVFIDEWQDVVKVYDFIIGR
jgi:PadR family transcriptional regulator, regulatory protein PadR